MTNITEILSQYRDQLETEIKDIFLSVIRRWLSRRSPKWLERERTELTTVVQSI